MAIGMALMDEMNQAGVFFKMGLNWIANLKTAVT